MAQYTTNIRLESEVNILNMYTIQDSYKLYKWHLKVNTNYPKEKWLNTISKHFPINKTQTAHDYMKKHWTSF